MRVVSRIARAVIWFFEKPGSESEYDFETKEAVWNDARVLEKQTDLSFHQAVVVEGMRRDLDDRTIQRILPMVARNVENIRSDLHERAALVEGDVEAMERTDEALSSAFD